MTKKITALILLLIFCFPTITHAFIDTSNSIAISVNETVSGRIRYQTQRMVYAIKPPSKGTVKLKFEYSKDAPENAYRMIIMSSTYQVINEKTSADDKISGDMRIHITNQARLGSGTFYVLICGFRNFDTSPFKLTVIHTSEAGEATETEFKNSTPFGTPIVKTDIAYKGNISNEFDIDYFCIKTPENKQSVSVSILPQDNSSYDLWQIDLYDKKLNNLQSFEGCGENVITLNLKEYDHDLIFFKVTKGSIYTNNDYKITFNTH